MNDEEISDSETSSLIKPSPANSKGYSRYIALVLLCLIGFGAYFCFDNPAALEDYIKRDLQISTTTFTSFYSWYSTPNVVLCFFGGFLVDRVFGVRVGAIIFLTLTLLGQLLFATGAFEKKVIVMDMGRFVQGVGSGCLSIVQNTYAVSWFFGKELNFVFGLLMSISHLGSTLNLIIMTPIYEALHETQSGTDSLGISLMIAALFVVFSLICSIFLCILDIKYKPKSAAVATQTQQKIHLTDVIKFPVPLWLVYCICVTFYCTLFPFISLSKVFFISKYGFAPAEAGRVSSVIYITSAFALPACGFLLDLIGYNTFFILAGLVVGTISHILVAFTFVNPYISMVLLGLSYSLMVPSLWPMVALIIPKHQLSTAYGLMFSIQSIGLAVTGVLGGIIVDQAGYFALQLFFLVLISVSFLSASILYFYDRIQNGLLGVSKIAREHAFKSNDKILNY